MRRVLIALSLFISTANAEDWQPVGELESHGSILLVDAARITDVKGLRRAWFKSVYTSDRPIPEAYLATQPEGASFRSELSVRYFNCPDRTSAVMKLYWYSADNQTVGYVYQDHLKFLPAAPGTLDEKALETVCTSGKLVDAEAAGLTSAAEQAKMVRPVNPDNYYPSSSRSRKEQGSPIVRVCVGPTGKPLREPEVTDSSGSPDLDSAAIKVARATKYAAGMEEGKAVAESCLRFKVKFGPPR